MRTPFVLRYSQIGGAALESERALLAESLEDTDIDIDFGDFEDVDSCETDYGDIDGFLDDFFEDDDIVFVGE